MRDLCCDSIESKSYLCFAYGGHQRVVVPCAVGTDAAGVAKLRAYQVDGTSSSGTPDPETPRLFLLDRIVGLEVADTSFEIPAYYTRGDSGLNHIWAEL